MSDIQDDAYSEACEEIEHLRAHIALLQRQNATLKSMIALAIVSLDKWNVRNRFSELIDELRQAAR